MARRKWKWTNFQKNRLNQVLQILTELEEFKPLTLRQIYYQLVGREFIENSVSQYTQLSRMLKYARIDKYIQWGDIEDRIRTYHSQDGFLNKQTFIKQELNLFLEYYNRNFMQTQEKYIEIWIEKDALSTLFVRAAQKYRVSVVVCRGFSSVSFLHDFLTRLKYSAHNKTPLMLYFGDFDPSGMAMLDSMRETLETEMYAPAIEFKRIALSREDIETYKLPHSPEALKKTDTRAAGHIKKFGEIAVELDALRPDVLIRKIQSSIENEIDIPLYNEEVRQQTRDIEDLKIMKSKVTEFLSG